MTCKIWCIVAFIFVGIFVSSRIVRRKTGMFNNFKNELNKSQLTIYLSIIKERNQIFTNGLILGMVVALSVAYYIHNHGKCNAVSILCIFIGITLATSTIFYMLSPNTKYMVLYLTTYKQRSLWIKIYKTFNIYKYYGILIAILIYIILNYRQNK